MAAEHDLDSPCRFVGPAKAFYDAQPPDVQADLTSIAAWLFLNAVEGDRKAYVVVPGPSNARQYRRVYHDDKYWLWYDRSPDDGGVLRLFVYDSGYYGRKT